MIDHVNGRDHLTLFFETDRPKSEWQRIEENLASIFKGKIGMTPHAKAVEVGELPRSEKKTRRIFDNRY